jgi:hypothetical protein
MLGKFDSLVYRNSINFLSALARFYQNRQNKAIDERERLLTAFTSTPERMAVFEKMRDTYENKAVVAAVKNVATANRIVEYDGKLVQRIYPIYMDDHKPKHYLDFSANLFQPTKHFAGYYIDTYYFNIAVIWSMTLFLFIALYFDWLKKLMALLEQGKHRKRDKN